MGIWIARDGKSYGPYEEQQIRQWIEAGTISIEDMALRDGDSSWVPLGQILSPNENKADDWIKNYSARKSGSNAQAPSVLPRESGMSSLSKFIRALTILIVVIAIGIVLGGIIDKIPI